MCKIWTFFVTRSQQEIGQTQLDFLGISASFGSEAGAGILGGFLGNGGFCLCQIRVDNVTEVNFFLTFWALVFKV